MKANLACPHCNQRAMSVRRKWQASFAWTGNCESCGQPIGIPAWSFHAAMVIGALAFVVFLWLPSRQALPFVLVVAVLQSVLQIYWVPIERREA